MQTKRNETVRFKAGGLWRREGAGGLVFEQLENGDGADEKKKTEADEGSN